MTRATESRRAQAPARRVAGETHRESVSPADTRRRVHRIGYYGQREELGLMERIGFLLAFNRSLPPGERIRWGWAVLAMLALFVCAGGLAVVLP